MLQVIPTLEELLVSLAIVAASLCVAWLARRFFDTAIHRLTRRTSTYLDNAVAAAINRPLIAAIIITGVYVAFVRLPLAGGVGPVIDRAFPTALTLLGIYTMAALIEELLKWYQVEVASKVQSALGHQLVYLCKGGIPVAAAMLAVLLVLEFFGIAVTPVKGWFAEHGARFALIVVMAIVAIFLLDQAIPKVISRSLARGKAELEEEARKRADTLGRVLTTAGQGFVLFVAVFMLLSEIGLDIAPVLAGVGVAGIAVGFGAQNLVRDILAGLFVIMENQYRVGDVVKVAGVSGLVEDINLRRTVLRDQDGAVHFVPNGEIKVASNLTKEWSRVNLDIPVGYGEDLDRVIAVLNSVGREMAADPAWATFILKAPQVLRVEKLGDSGIDVKVAGDTRPLKQWDVAGELRLRVKKAFDREGIEIPWPHTKVYFGNELKIETRETGNKS
ncbi:MAG: mechanosensitive ion channel family protein [Chloroflexi bacterium]|nr:mechanosensitive ion channel family protein [Chloroflexota bacterium]